MTNINSCTGQSANDFVVLKNDPKIITPKLCGGYELPGKMRHVYYPALNQIWIDAKSLSKKEQILILAHESMHVYTISLQPAQLLPLRAELLGFVDRPNQKCFDDIVETVCDGSFWGLTRLGIADIEEVIAEAKHPDLLAKLFELAKRLIKKQRSETGDEAQLKEAVLGLCLLLMHIVPHQARLGQKVLQQLLQFPILSTWQNRWQVYLYYYANLSKKLEQSRQLSKQITLVLPIDVHRCIADMIIFLSMALNAVYFRPVAVTAVFPTLLSLVTQGCFMLLPVIYLRKMDNNCTAEIRIVHNTSSRSKKTPNKAADLQLRMYAKFSEQGVICGAAPIFATLIEISERFAASSVPDRTAECFRDILHRLPSLLRKHISTSTTCEGCKRIFRGDIFCSAFEVIVDMSQENRRAMVDTARHYEVFLLGEAMNVIKDKCDLSDAPKPARRYRFL